MDKLDVMNREIKSKITDKLKSKFSLVELEYIDIKLDIIIADNKDGHITLDAFSRGHYVRENMKHRIKHAPSADGTPSSDKGDGSLFLALVVNHCNEVFGRRIPYWIGGVTDWWRIKGVCAIENACKKTNRSRHAYEINNDFFMEWSNNRISKFHDTISSGGKRLRKRKTRKARRKTRGRLRKRNKKTRK